MRRNNIHSKYSKCKPKEVMDVIIEDSLAIDIKFTSKALTIPRGSGPGNPVPGVGRVGLPGGPNFF